MESNSEDKNEIKDFKIDQLEISNFEGAKKINKQPLVKRVCLIILKILALLAVLYGFLVGLALLSDAFRVLTAKSASNLFSFVNNPIAGLMVGIIVTVLFQSSSTTTSIIVSLVGADVITVGNSVPIIMGANIGTSVTNTIVSIGQIGSGTQFRKSFAGATVHDAFNILNVCVWLPIEWIVMAANNSCGFLCYICNQITHQILHLKGATFESPLDSIIKPFAKLFVEVDKKVYQAYSFGCDGTSATFCSNEASNVTDGCFDGGGKCIDAFKWHDIYDDASIIKKSFLKDTWGFNDIGSGIFLLILALFVLCGCLLLLVKLLQSLIMGQAEVYLRKALNMNGYLAIVIGACITVLLQSSSVVTSALTPLVGVGVLQLEGMLPLTLGANIGTTVTAMLASLATNNPNSVTTSLCHLFFNLFGTIVFYPIPFMRNIPLNIARGLGNIVFKYRWFGFVYLIIAFLIAPGYLLISSILLSGSKDSIIGGVIMILLTVIIIIGFLVWYYLCSGHIIMTKVLLKLASKDYLDEIKNGDNNIQVVIECEDNKNINNINNNDNINNEANNNNNIQKVEDNTQITQ